MLYYESLDVYQRAIEFVARAVALAEGKTQRADQARYHAMARGSAMECGAIIDVIGILDPSAKPTLDEAKQLIVRIVAMLTKMCR